MHTKQVHYRFKKAVLLSVFLCAGIISLRAQVKFGNNPGTINANSVLELEATNKGLLLPRVALTSLTAAAPLSAHVAGMVVYNTATAGTAPNNVIPGYYYNNGSNWLRLATMGDVVLAQAALSSPSSPAGIAVGQMLYNTNASSGLPVGPVYWDGTQWQPVAGNDWKTTGNAGTTGANFLGTTDSRSLRIRTNNVERMVVDSMGRVQLGTSTATIVASATSGSTTAQQLAKLTVANGDADINGLTIGRGAGQKVDNTALGKLSLFNNTTGSRNVAIGTQTLSNVTTGSRNVAVGTVTLNALIDGSFNTGLGDDVLFSATTGNGNTSVGRTSLYKLTNGSDNIAIGSGAGYNQTQGSKNILIGVNANATSLTGSNQMNIGNLIFGTGVNSATGAGQLMVGTATVPTGGTNSKLIINNGTTAGALQIIDGTQGEGKVLKSDANGVATWVASATATSILSYAEAYPATMTIPNPYYNVTPTFSVSIPGIYKIRLDITIPTNVIVVVDNVSTSGSSLVRNSTGATGRIYQDILVFLTAGTHQIKSYCDGCAGAGGTVTGYKSISITGPVN